jgi:hypothetical protein
VRKSVRGKFKNDQTGKGLENTNKDISQKIKKMKHLNKAASNEISFTELV